jgi:membrane fusion protein, multidrug efflux system
MSSYQEKFHAFMASRFTYPLVAAVGIAVASGVAWWYQSKGPDSGPKDVAATGAAAQPGAALSAQAVTVEVARVEVTRLVDDALTVGSLRSRQSVVVRPEVSGRVVQLNFHDGERVRKGQLLVQFDDQLQLAQVKQSQAELSIARANHKRNQELLAQNFISQRTVDESAANLEVALAKLALSEATAARLKIVAPFDGMTGIRTVNPGDYLKDGADIVNIEDIDAVFVDFRLPERYQTQVKKGQKATIELDALPGQKFEALIQAIDPLIEANGRSVSVRGCIDNRGMQLRPGMFARVTAQFGVRENALVVPEEAIVPQGARQFVIKLEDGADKGIKLSKRVEVKVGIRRPGRVEILEGLKAGDVVVAAGQQRLQRDGTPVQAVEVGRDATSPAVSGALAGSATVGVKAGATRKPVPAAVAGENPCLVMTRS